MSGRWVAAENTDGAVRLFCFAHAGGGSGFFRPWQSRMAPEIAVTPVVLPGREARWREPGYTRMEHLIEPLCEGILPFLDRPFALFGHSLGAAVAYEVARRLPAYPGGTPLRLIVSGRRAPHLPARRPPIHHLPADEFLAEIARLNGTASQLLNDDGLLRALLPSLRADFELSEHYSPRLGPPLAFAVSAMVSDRDVLVDAGEMRRWGEVTVGEFSLRVFDGDHFYLAGGRPDVLAGIREDVRRAVRLAESQQKGVTVPCPASS